MEDKDMVEVLKVMKDILEEMRRASPTDNLRYVLGAGIGDLHGRIYCLENF